MTKDMVRPKWTTKRFPIDAFLISGHMHMGAGSSMHLMRFLGSHPAVRSYGMVTYNAPGGYDEQAIKHIRSGKVNTLFIDPGTVGADTVPWFDAGPFLDKIRNQFPAVVIVLYTWDNCRRLFLEKHPKFSHYFFYLYQFVNSELPNDYIETNNNLDVILSKCEFWHQSRHEYDVALSFAGEDRQWAEKLALALRAEGVRVFYDDFEQAKLIGGNLIETLFDVYSRRCRHTVILVSKAYSEKIWTTHERRAAQDRALKDRGSDFILPIRIDDSELPALSDSTAYVRIEEGVDSIVDLIVQKLWHVDPDALKAHIGGRLY